MAIYFDLIVNVCL